LTTQHAETISPRPLEHREWVCAVGLQADSERVLRYTAQVAETFHGNLLLIHAISSSEPGLAVQLDLDERMQSAERQVAAHHRLEELQRNADLLVIGRSPQAGDLGRLRDLTYAVVRDCTLSGAERLK
jgi:K+-sensing histidine kinase KdpD